MDVGIPSLIGHKKIQSKYSLSDLHPLYHFSHSELFRCLFDLFEQSFPMTVIEENIVHHAVKERADQRSARYSNLVIPSPQRDGSLFDMVYENLFRRKTFTCFSSCLRPIVERIDGLERKSPNGANVLVSANKIQHLYPVNLIQGPERDWIVRDGTFTVSFQVRVCIFGYCNLLIRHRDSFMDMTE